MDSAYAGNEILFRERYPDLSFLLTLYAGQQERVSYHMDDEISRFLETYSSLDQIEIFYLYGIGSGEHYTALLPWLREKSERVLIILEDDMEAINAWLESSSASSLIQDPQVYLEWMNQELSSYCDALTKRFPSDRVEVAAIEYYALHKHEKFQELRLQLLRSSTVAQALLAEALYSHHLLENLIPHIGYWPRSFFANGLKGQFQGIPAIICGAGPSLASTFQQLKCIEDRALIIAGGSTITALSNQGILPHLGIALDPNSEEYDRLKAASSFQIPFLYASRLESRVFMTCNGDKGYLRTQTGGACEAYFEQAVEIHAPPIGPELGHEALSVTTLAIALAVEMGCNPIILNGIDLAYTGMRRYAEGVMPTSQVFREDIQKVTRSGERLIETKDMWGQPVLSLMKWVMESECIGAYVKAHSESHFINTTPAGLGFPGIEQLSFDQMMKEHLHTPIDLFSLIHATTTQLNLSVTDEKISDLMEQLTTSLIRLDEIATEMIEELQRVKDLDGCLPTGKTAILEIDFQEECAFECLFLLVGPALDQLLNRAFFASPLLSEEQKRRLYVQRQFAKWTQWRTMIREESAILSRINNHEITPLLSSRTSESSPRRDALCAHNSPR